MWSDDARTDSLVIAGPFRYLRNPLYVGNILMALSFSLFAPIGGWIDINVMNLVFVGALIRWEERGLESSVRCRLRCLLHNRSLFAAQDSACGRQRVRSAFRY